jgi:hypothetical protein
MAGLLLASSQSGCFLVGYEGQLERGPGENGRDDGGTSLDATLVWPLDATHHGDGDARLGQDGHVPSHDASHADDGGGEFQGDSGATRHDGGGHVAHDSGSLTDSGSGNGDGDSGGSNSSGDGDGGGGSLHDAGYELDAQVDSGGVHATDAGHHTTPDSGTSTKDGGAPWWQDVPPTNACTAGAYYCSQKCTTVDSPCVFDCSSISCTPSCQASTTCHTSCASSTLGASCVNSCAANADCVHDCTSIQCSTSCAAGANCELDCHTGAASCVVSCTLGAHCLVNCGGATTCTMDCKGALLSCPGNITTCDRACP